MTFKSCLHTQCSQQRNDAENAAIADSKPNLGFCPETTPKHNCKEGDIDTLGDASKEGNDTRGCHHRWPRKNRAGFSFVLLHISTPPRFVAAPTL